MKRDLGDLFAIFPDLPWPRITTSASAAERRMAIADSVRATRASAARARARFSKAINEYAMEAARRRDELNKRHR